MAIHDVSSNFSSMTGADGRANGHCVGNFNKEGLSDRLDTIYAFTQNNTPLGYEGLRIHDENMPLNLVMTLDDDDMEKFLTNRGTTENLTT